MSIFVLRVFSLSLTTSARNHNMSYHFSHRSQRPE